VSESPSTCHADVWTETFTLRAYECDGIGHATPQTICNLLQEVANNHAHALGVAIDQIVETHRETWMLQRLSLRIVRTPRWRELVSIETWPCGLERLWSVREFVLRDAQGAVLATACTGWLMIDLATRAATRHPRTPINWCAERPRGMPESLRTRVPRLEVPRHERGFEARRSDVDRNAHVNHVHVITWALEGIPAAMLGGAELSEVDVDFVGEVIVDDRVLSSATPNDDGWLHRVSRVADGVPLAWLRTKWRPRGEAIAT
jgi:acyl-ACP thioesterase